MRPTITAIIIAASASAHATRLVVTDGTSASLIEAGATSAKVVATIKLRATVQTIVWIGRDPVALLDDGEVGTLTAKGFVAIATPPSSAFVLPRPSKNVQQLEQPVSELVGSTTGELWLGRCDWGFPADGHMICENWIYARLGAGGVLTSRAHPPDGNRNWEGWPAVEPATSVAITFAPRPHDDGTIDDHAETMTCRYNGTTTTFPEGKLYWTYQSTLQWISHDPPMFIIDSIANGMTGIVERFVFEGCTPSNAPGVKGYVGPDDLSVLALGTASSLSRHGKELLALSGADLVAFEPPLPRPPAKEAFAVLERELAGDASMFARDAIVLSPAPAIGAPKLVKHATSRIERFATRDLGDAMLIAAELVLDGKPYRTLQLFDATGHVIVATFAPVKSLAAGGAAPVLPSPTPTGPLAALAASPASASKVVETGSVVFGTELAEYAIDDGQASADLLASWSKLALTLDPAVHEVHTARYGYAITSVALGKSRMIALVIGAPTKTGWELTAIHYVGL
ncbi:MAG TPA: hypothetical protein VH143_17395 [Kofleriaceae bacterium]|jgi:hypothetical protein|nr:hypothetical protein [Kofleriaceae bacterium]